MNKQLMTVRIIDRAGGKIPAVELEAKMGLHYSRYTRSKLAEYGYIEPSPTGSPGAAGPRDYVLTDLGRQYAHTGEHPMGRLERKTLERKVQPTTVPASMPKMARLWVVYHGNQEIEAFYARTREEAIDEMVRKGASREGLDARPWTAQPPRKPYTNGSEADPKAEALRVLTEYRNKLAADLVKVNAAIGELTR